MSRVLSIPEVADRLGVHTQTVRAMIKRGDLKGVRIGHPERGRLGSTEEYVDRYIADHSIDPDDDERRAG